MNFVYENIEEETYKKVKIILLKIGKPSIEDIAHCNESLKFSGNKGSLSIRYYKSKKLMFQGNLENIGEIIEELEKNLGIFPNEKKEKTSNDFPEKNINKDFFLGFDEAGRGETFGSLFLSGVVVKKENLEYLKGMLGNKNIKKMKKNQLDNLFNAIKDKFSYLIKQSSSKDVDSLQITTLLDRGYIELIKSLTKESDKEALFFDDYGIGYELKIKFEELKKNNSYIVASFKADEKYLACSLASLVSRRARLKEMENLSKNNVIIDPETGEKISFNSGSASDPETEKYLITYRKLYPFSDLPSFVRTKWGNVREIERTFPKQTNTISFKCKSCNKESYKICMHYDLSKLNTECFCPQCGKKIDVVELKGFFKNKDIIIDTSVIISRIISKDFETSKHLEGCKFIIPSILYEELDSKQPKLKRGGQKEIEYLRNLHENKEIILENFDIEDYTEVKNDKKFLRILRSKNGVMLTKDNNLSNFSEISEFVIHIIDDKDYYLKKKELI